MKLWVDDVRKPPGWNDGKWAWAKTSDEGIACLRDMGPYEELSLDHDLGVYKGGYDTTRPIVLWLCKNPEYWPKKVWVHTANPVGRVWLEGMIERYKP